MAASAPCGAPRSFSHSACRHSSRAASTWVSNSASGCDTPWKADSGLPKASRSATKAQVSSSAMRATASTCSPISAREKSKPCITCTKPRFSSPSRWSSGTRTFSKKSAPRPMARWPWQSKRLRVNPGRSAGTSSAVTPCAPDSTLPVRPKTTIASAWSAAEIDVFSPLTTYSAPTRSTRRRRLAASDPPRGSVSAIASKASPRVSRCSQGVATPGCPCADSICPFSEASRLIYDSDRSARAISSWITPAASVGRPWPPKRSGSSGAMKPSAPIARISSRSSTRVRSRSWKPGATRSTAKRRAWSPIAIRSSSR